MQSQEADNIMRGLSNQNDYYNHSSYLNNSSVAKTAVHKRRNISVGVTNDVMSGISIPNLENTYDGLENQRQDRINTSQLNTEPQKKGYSGYLDELSRQQQLSQFNTDQQYISSIGGKGTSFNMHNGGKNQLVQKLNSHVLHGG